MVENSFIARSTLIHGEISALSALIGILASKLPLDENLVTTIAITCIAVVGATAICEASDLHKKLAIKSQTRECAHLLDVLQLPPEFIFGIPAVTPSLQSLSTLSDFQKNDPEILNISEGTKGEHAFSSLSPILRPLFSNDRSSIQSEHERVKDKSKIRLTQQRPNAKITIDCGYDDSNEKALINWQILWDNEDGSQCSTAILWQPQPGCVRVRQEVKSKGKVILQLETIYHNGSSHRIFAYTTIRGASEVIRKRDIVSEYSQESLSLEPGELEAALGRNHITGEDVEGHPQLAQILSTFPIYSDLIDVSRRKSASSGKT